MKTIKTALLLSAIALLIPTSARAEWVYVTNDDDTQTYIQTDSITYKNKKATFVIHNLLAFPDQDGAIDFLHHVSIDCSTGIRYSHRLTGFNRTGKVVYDEIEGSPRLPSPPGSRGADIYNFVCR